MENRELVHRLSRLQGQLNSVKASVEGGDYDCLKVMQQLKAANNALKKFGHAFVSNHFHDCLDKKNMGKAELERNLDEVIEAAFYL